MATNFRNMQDGGFRLVPRSTDPSSPVEGDIQFADGTVRAKGVWEYKNSGWSQVSSSSSGINYIAGGNAESGISSFVTYADAAGSLPVDGTGGSPNVTFAVSSSSPLRGLNNFLFTKDAANRQGQGASYAFTLDRADMNQVLNVSFDYEIGSGTFASGDLTVYLYDVTNAVVIQPSGFSIQSLNASVTSKHLAQFQTTTSTSYRLIFHVASVSASAYTVKMENIVLGPQVVQYGAPVTDEQPYTVTTIGAGGTLVNSQFVQWRTGKFLNIRGKVTLGTVAANTFTFPLPPGLSIDSTNLTSALNILGRIEKVVGGSNFTQDIVLFYHSSSSTLLHASDGGGGTQTSLSQRDTNNMFASGDSILLEAQIPILGWSSSVQMSNDTDTRVVAARVTGAPANVTSNNPFIFPTISNDTHGGYSTITGLYTVQVPGFYSISTTFLADVVGAATNISIFKNGSSFSVIGAFPNVNGYGWGSGLVYAVAGDTLSVRPNGNVSTINALSNLNIERLTGPSAIAASESVNARYSTAAGQLLTNNTITVIDFETKTYDSHGSVTTGAAFKFTSPISGKIGVSTEMVLANDADWTSLENYYIYIYKNGTEFSKKIWSAPLTSAGYLLPIAIRDVVPCVAGDTIDIRVRQNSGGDVSLEPGYNSITFNREGN